MCKTMDAKSKEQDYQEVIRRKEMEEEVNQPSEDILEREGKLVVEYKGGQYKLEIDDATGYVFFKGKDPDFENRLRQAYTRVLCEESNEADKRGDYWYERPYAIGRKAAESLGAKIIEYENEVYKKFYEDGTPILY